MDKIDMEKVAYPFARWLANCITTIPMTDGRQADIEPLKKSEVA